jgi:2-amino-4-hydroxy-6-hydroxymethyldihydropteridine diphosphokinase
VSQAGALGEVRPRDRAEVRRGALALGSNLGERGATLRAAVSDLAATAGITVVTASSVYETAPVGGPEQGPYLNAVIVIDTDLHASDVLAAGHAVEALHGRARLERWGPRTLDVDVLALGAEVSTGPELVLPHPRLADRGFVLVPWAEVDPTFVVPGLGRVLDLLAALPPEAVADVHPYALDLALGEPA